jgi:hypothetical protein
LSKELKGKKERKSFDNIHCRLICNLSKLIVIYRIHKKKRRKA